MNTGLTQVLADGTNTYLYGNGRIAQAGSTTEYFLGDALGSVRQLADSASVVMLTQSYSPYGETISSMGSGASAYQFTGESRDANGLTYLRARYYNSGDGRFVSRDTWGGDYNRPLSLNRWGYAEGSPVMYSDPSGHCVFGLDTIVCVVAGAGAVYTVGYLTYDHYFPQGTQPQDTNLGWWSGQLMGYGNLQEDLAVMSDCSECPLRRGLAGTGALLNTTLGISVIHGALRAVASIPKAVQIFSSGTPVQALKSFAQSRGVTYHATSYIDDAGRTFANYRPPGTSTIYVDPTGKSKLELVSSFMHELAHVEQGTGIAHQISAASASTGNILNMPYGCFLNPVEVNAAASAFGLGGNNFAILVGSRGLLDGGNTIKYGPHRDISFAQALSRQYNKLIDNLCEKMGYE